MAISPRLAISSFVMGLMFPGAEAAFSSTAAACAVTIRAGRREAGRVGRAGRGERDLTVGWVKVDRRGASGAVKAGVDGEDCMGKKGWGTDMGKDPCKDGVR